MLPLEEIAVTTWRSRIVETGTADPRSLIANPKNWRKHPKTQADALSGVLGEVGWVQDVIVNRTTGRLVDGHLRVEIAARDNQPTIPVTYVELTEAEEALILATFDPISAMATADAEILRELKACGYRVSARLLDAAYFGVPQHRQRMILIGVREDLDVDSTHPRAITKPIPVSVALDSVVNTADDLATPTAWGTNPRWAVSTYIPRIRPGKSCDDVHPKKAGYNLIRLDASRTSPTIPKTCNGSLFAGILPPIGDRYCTIPEIKRLGSFPDAFRFVGGFEQEWARIGNSVPPLFMRAIAEHIRDNILAPSTAQAVAD